jgi:glutamate formiminotransferase/formiminotetrahydrofolate cyclodeaminase
MVANLSAHKRGWDDKWEYFSNWAEKGERLRASLLLEVTPLSLICHFFLNFSCQVDADTRAFNKLMDSFSRPKGNDVCLSSLNFEKTGRV